VALTAQATTDGMPTLWAPAGAVHDLLRYLKVEALRPYRMLYDLTAIDERERTHREGQPAGDFSVVYQLLSFDRNADVRVKVTLEGDTATLPTITDLWPCANWYEREAWDMFGITFAGHPHLCRILLPPWWEGHALRKEHPSRRTEMGPFNLPGESHLDYEAQMRFRPEEWGLETEGEDFDFMFLNIGPNHPATHGVLRLVVQLDGQEVVNVVPDIGFHHRAAEKMGERQTWHTYIPYTDRIDYLSGVLNEFPYVLAVETLAGITVPDRAQVIRIMMAELFRVISHLVFFGTFVQDVGMMSPVFYMFTDRERALQIVSAVTGGRMHPSYFRIGGVALDLPDGWEAMVRDFLAHMGKQLAEYEKAVLRNHIFRMRTVGIGDLTTEQAIEWCASGPVLRSTGLAWDTRKQQPYGGYDQFDFDVPAGTRGDSYDRVLVHLEEMRQSLRIIEQCANHMPEGRFKAEHPLATPPVKSHTMHDIETLIDHFLGVSWGPVIPAGEATARIEGAKGLYSYALVSDGNTVSYRTRIHTPSFAHIQMLPHITKGVMVPDLIAILASLDFVLGEIDR
jgi:NADH-quinone oxidoreductase subunit C/D